MQNFNLPAVVLREAWSIVRLAVIHETVSQTIIELGQLVDKEDQTRGSTGADPAGESARRMALHVCTVELMNEAGLDSGTLVSPPDRAPNGLSWDLEYSEAIDRYRGHAATSLCATLGVGGAAVGSE